MPKKPWAATFSNQLIILFNCVLYAKNLWILLFQAAIWKLRPKVDSIFC